MKLPYTIRASLLRLDDGAEGCGKVCHLTASRRTEFCWALNVNDKSSRNIYDHEYT